MLQEAHRFDWSAVLGGLDYYQQVKAVNYLRREVATQHCPACHAHCSSPAHLMLHMGVKGHCSLPSDISIWDQAQYVIPLYLTLLLYTLLSFYRYLFPTFENDALLCFLDDSTDSTHNEATPTCEEAINIS